MQREIQRGRPRAAFARLPAPLPMAAAANAASALHGYTP